MHILGHLATVSGHRGFLVRVEQQECKADHSPLSSAKVTNTRSVTPTPHTPSCRNAWIQGKLVHLLKKDGGAVGVIFAEFVRRKKRERNTSVRKQMSQPRLEAGTPPKKKTNTLATLKPFLVAISRS